MDHAQVLKDHAEGSC